MNDNSILRLRRERRWSQHQLLHELSRAAQARRIVLPEEASLRITLSGWENGRHRPGSMYRQLLADALEVSEADLGFDACELPRPISVGSGTVSYLSSMFAIHTRADQDLGSQLLISVVSEQTKQAEVWAQGARGEVREPLLRIVSRYAEFCGWLHQDQGDFRQADFWTRRAIELSQELGDQRLVAYGLTRRSNIATESRRPEQGLHLAEAALRQRADLDSRLIALALRQTAVAHAMLRETQPCVVAVRRGADAVAGAQLIHAESDYCTVPYIAMEGGHALMIAGRLQDSIALLTSALAEWPHGQHRDRGLCLARLANAYAEEGRIEESCETGKRALIAMSEAPSARTATALRDLRGKLLPHRRQSDVADLRELLARAV